MEEGGPEPAGQGKEKKVVVMFLGKEKYTVANTYGIMSLAK